MTNAKRRIPAKSQPFNNNVADFPALQSWFKFMENAGTSLTDSAGNVTGMTLNGTGSHWAVPHAASFDITLADYALTPLTNVGFSAPKAGEVWIIEAEVYIPSSGVAGILTELGQRTTSVQTDFGSLYFHTDINLGELRVVMGVRNTIWSTASGLTTGATFSNQSKSPLDIRKSIIAVYDFTDPNFNLIPVSAYVDGILVAQEALDSTALGGFETGDFMTNGNFVIGGRNDGTKQRFTGRQYNNRAWKLSNLPDNLQAIVTQMRNNPSELPPLLEGAL